MIIVRALIELNEAKFKQEDLPIFHMILQDVFPGLDYFKESLPWLSGAIKN